MLFKCYLFSLFALIVFCWMSRHYFSLGLKFKATLLMQNRWPVGSGPSSKTCPRWASHYKIKWHVIMVPGNLKRRVEFYYLHCMLANSKRVSEKANTKIKPADIIVLHSHVCRSPLFLCCPASYQGDGRCWRDSRLFPMSHEPHRRTANQFLNHI